MPVIFAIVTRGVIGLATIQRQIPVSRPMPTRLQSILHSAAGKATAYQAGTSKRDPRTVYATTR